MTFTPILWLLAFLPALVALYFLKLRRRDVGRGHNGAEGAVG